MKNRDILFVSIIIACRNEQKYSWEVEQTKPLDIYKEVLNK